MDERTKSRWHAVEEEEGRQGPGPDLFTLGVAPSTF